ncbi:MAG: zf-HC2 domain-containing protein [Elusimicrobiota bacterium]|nr:MAG: zf-HC2 domain-containing protein [Elusimicrobiota bacterium]
MSMLPSCKEVARLLSDAMDGRPIGLHAKLHLSVCDVCRRLLEHLTILRRACKSDAGCPGLSPLAKARLKKALE